MNNLITIDPQIMSGTPVFKNTRVPIQNLFDYLETGESLDDFLNDYPSVNKDLAIGILVAAKKLITASSEIFNDENIA